MTIEGISNITATKLTPKFKEFYKFVNNNNIKLPSCNKEKMIREKHKYEKFPKHEYF